MDSRKALAFRGILGFVLVCGFWMAVTLWNLSYDSVVTYLKTLTSLAVEDLVPLQHFHFFKSVFLSGLVLFSVCIGALYWNFLTILDFFAKRAKEIHQFFTDLRLFIIRCWQELTPLERGVLIFFILLGWFFYGRSALQPLRSDEATILISYASKPLWMIPALYQNVGNHIFHTVLMHLSVSLFGMAPLVVRLPVLLAGMTLLPLGYMVFRCLGTKVTALGTTVLMATSSALILYAGNSRGYMIQTVLSLGILGLSCYLRSRNNLAIWGLWGLLSALCFWTVPTTLYLYSGLWLWIAYDRFQAQSSLKPLILTSLFSGILTGILYGPALIVAKGLGHMNTMIGGAGQGSTFINFMPTVAMDWLQNWPNLYGVALILVGLGVLRHLFHRQLLAIFLAIGLVAVSSIIFMPYPRLYLAFIPFFYALLIEGVTWITQRGALGVIIVLGLWTGFDEYIYERAYHNPHDAFHRSKMIAEDLKPYLQPGDAITVPCPGGFPLYYQFLRQGYKLYQHNLMLGKTAVWTMVIAGNFQVPVKRLWRISMKTPEGVLRTSFDNELLPPFQVRQTKLVYKDAVVEMIQLISNP